ncbi:hypothetical protein PG994_013374 [Apiospora phragmitis]|uniref:Uncharacterized protein n=1 Tax=Apiospora phragmitis TaxID=2905665 RepID=A0ABR1TA66_9PEZI
MHAHHTTVGFGHHPCCWDRPIVGLGKRGSHPENLRPSASPTATAAPTGGSVALPLPVRAYALCTCGTGYVMYAANGLPASARNEAVGEKQRMKRNPNVHNVD